MNTERTEETTSLLSALQDLYVMIDCHLVGCMCDQRLWETMESFYRVSEFVHLLPEEAQIAALESTRYSVNVNQSMIDWSEGIEPYGGWSKELLDRLAPDTRPHV